jgi:hypothetical protein
MSATEEIDTSVAKTKGLEIADKGTTIYQQSNVLMGATEEYMQILGLDNAQYRGYISDIRSGYEYARQKHVEVKAEIVLLGASIAAVDATRSILGSEFSNQAVNEKAKAQSQLTEANLKLRIVSDAMAEMRQDQTKIKNIISDNESRIVELSKITALQQDFAIQANKIAVLGDSLVYLANSVRANENKFSSSLSSSALGFLNSRFDSEQYLGVTQKDTIAYTQLFDNGISFTDIEQGLDEFGVGNCWLLAPLMILAMKNPSLLQKSVKYISDKEIQVTLRDKDGKLVTVSVDTSKGGYKGTQTNERYIRAIEQAYSENSGLLLGRRDVNGGYQEDEEKIFASFGINTDKNHVDEARYSDGSFDITIDGKKKNYYDVATAVKDNPDKSFILATGAAEDVTNPPEYWVGEHATVIEYENGNFYHSNPWGFNPPNQPQRMQISESDLNKYYGLRLVVEVS